MKKSPNLLPKSCLVNIPKTGGTWIREHFNEMGWWESLGQGHMPVADIDPELIKHKEPFTFVRHPVTWLRSWWSFLLWRMEANHSSPSRLVFLRNMLDTKREAGDLESFDNFELLAGAWSPSIDEFFDNIWVYRRDIVDRVYLTYCEGIKLEHVGRQETLKDDLVRILYSVGEDLDYDRIQRWDDRRNVSWTGGNRNPDIGCCQHLLNDNPWTTRMFGYNMDNLKL